MSVAFQQLYRLLSRLQRDRTADLPTAPLVHLAALTTNAIACAALIDYGVRGIVLAWTASLALGIAGHLILIERRGARSARHPVRATADLAAAERTMR